MANPLQCFSAYLQFLLLLFPLLGLSMPIDLGEVCVMKSELDEVKVSSQCPCPSEFLAILAKTVSHPHSILEFKCGKLQETCGQCSINQHCDVTNGNCISMMSLPDGSVVSHDQNTLILFDLRCASLFVVDNKCSSGSLAFKGSKQSILAFIQQRENNLRKDKSEETNRRLVKALSIIMNIQFLENNEASQRILKLDKESYWIYKEIQSFMKITMIRQLDDYSDTVKNKNEPSLDSSTQKAVIIIVIIIAVVALLFLIITCIRRSGNSNGFASLAAGLELPADHVRMIKVDAGAMSMGSSNNSNGQPNQSSKEAKENKRIVDRSSCERIVEQVKPLGAGGIQEGISQQLKQIKGEKFSRRVVQVLARNENPENSMLHSKEDNSTPLQTAPMALLASLHIVQNNGLQNTSGINNPHAIGTNIALEMVENSSKRLDQQKNGRDEEGEGVRKVKRDDTSMHENFFSIDGEEEDEKREKIIGSIQVDSSSDDTTFSNVFNLEGEEPEKTTSQRKKKKKIKHQNHLFFEDQNAL